eukprot:365900-Chlamydomonas_euryale.AAC.2
MRCGAICQFNCISQLSPNSLCCNRIGEGHRGRIVDNGRIQGLVLEPPVHTAFASIPSHYSSNYPLNAALHEEQMLMVESAASIQHWQDNCAWWNCKKEWLRRYHQRPCSCTELIAHVSQILGEMDTSRLFMAERGER